MDSRILPEMFCTAYEAVCVQALDDGSGGGNHPLSGRAAELGRAEGKPTGQWPVKSDEKVSIGQKSGPGSSLKTVGKTSKFLRDERAFRLKQRMDKRLRAMAREMMAFMDGKEIRAAVSRVCTGKCKKLGDAEWMFCARCGGPMRDLDEGE